MSGNVPSARLRGGGGARIISDWNKCGVSKQSWERCKQKVAGTQSEPSIFRVGRTPGGFRPADGVPFLLERGEETGKCNSHHGNTKRMFRIYLTHLSPARCRRVEYQHSLINIVL